MVSKVKGRAHNCDAITVHVLKKLWNEEQSCPKLTTVRRNLFGFYERKDAGQLLEKQVVDMAKQSQQQWNFDFINELPESGRYVWQKVRSCDVPFWYAEIDRPMFKDFSNRPEVRVVDSESVSLPIYSLTHVKIDPCPVSEDEKMGRLSESEVEQKKRDQPRRKKPRLVQTSMKDYTKVKKRRSSCRLRLKQLHVFSNRLRSHHIIPERSA